MGFSLARLFASATGLLAVALAAGPLPQGEEFLSWPAAQAEATGKAMYEKGRVGGFWDTRLLKTERSYNYKLAATWLTPEVIRARARLLQLEGLLSAEQTRAIVAEAEAAGEMVVLVELDPREGSGVIPLEWHAFLQPRAQGLSPRAVAGVNTPELRKVRGLAGVLRQNYDYDRFWIVFPLLTRNSEPVFHGADRAAELVVRVFNNEGRVHWIIPDSIRRKIAAAAPAKN